MTCRHAAGDPDCSSSPEGRRRAAEESARYVEQTKTQRIKELEERTPDPDKFEIEDSEQVGPNVVLKVRYPSCVRCSYNANKVMVYLNITLKDVLRWRRIDPHFFDSREKNPVPYNTDAAKHAPSPVARFPASPEGWQDALEYADRKWRAANPTKLGLMQDV